MAKARGEAWREWYDNLETKQGKENIFRIERTRAKQKKDIVHTAVIRNDNQKVLTKEEDIKQRWQEYFKELLNVENERGDLDTAEPIEGPIEDITIEEVRQAIKGMKMGKATRPTGAPAEQLKNLDDEGIEWFREDCPSCLGQSYMKKKYQKWKKSYIVPIYKEKGDPLECKNHRGIKLLEHGLKVLEMILDKRLRSLIDISEDQFGFMKGKGTTDAIFTVRQVQNLERQKKIFYAFLDLEKAYD